MAPAVRGILSILMFTQKETLIILDILIIITALLQFCEEQLSENDIYRVHNTRKNNPNLVFPAGHRFGFFVIFGNCDKTVPRVKAQAAQCQASASLSRSTTLCLAEWRYMTAGIAYPSRVKTGIITSTGMTVKWYR